MIVNTDHTAKEYNRKPFTKQLLSGAQSREVVFVKDCSSTLQSIYFCSCPTSLPWFGFVFGQSCFGSLYNCFLWILWWCNGISFVFLFVCLFFLRGVRRACFIKLLALLSVVLEDVPSALPRVRSIRYVRNTLYERHWPGKAYFS